MAKRKNNELFDKDCGDIIGYFGICEVAFCVWCMSSITDMVIQLKHFLLI